MRNKRGLLLAPFHPDGMWAYPWEMRRPPEQTHINRRRRVEPAALAIVFAVGFFVGGLVGAILGVRAALWSEKP